MLSPISEFKVCFGSFTSYLGCASHFRCSTVVSAVTRVLRYN